MPEDSTGLGPRCERVTDISICIFVSNLADKSHTDLFGCRKSFDLIKLELGRKGLKSEEGRFVSRQRLQECTNGAVSILRAIWTGLIPSTIKTADQLRRCPTFAQRERNERIRSFGLRFTTGQFAFTSLQMTPNTIAVRFLQIPKALCHDGS